MPELNPQQWQAITAEILAGNKIAAIKLYRELAGADLAGAKHAVEKMEADLRRAQPEMFKPAARKSGCGAAALVMLILLAAAMVMLISRVTG